MAVIEAVPWSTTTYDSLFVCTMDQVSWQYKTLHPIKYIKIYHQSAVLPDTANYILEYYFIICQFLLCGHILVIYTQQYNLFLRVDYK